MDLIAAAIMDPSKFVGPRQMHPVEGFASWQARAVREVLANHPEQMPGPCICRGCMLGRELAGNVVLGVLSADSAGTALLSYHAP